MFEIDDLDEQQKRNVIYTRVLLPEVLFEAAYPKATQVQLILSRDMAIELACDLQQLHTMAGLTTHTGEYMEELQNYYQK